jgi:Mrp family chromosome partitioning ATPase
MEERPADSTAQYKNSSSLNSVTKIAGAVGCPSNRLEAGFAKICENCPGRGLCQTLNKLDLDSEEHLKIRMNAIRHKILVMAGKGGVGKSSIACQLAIGIAKRGQKVGVLDVDICGPSIPKLLKVEKGEVVNSQWGWMPVKSPFHDIVVMSIGFLIQGDSAPVIWRGPRKTNLIKRFLKDTLWGRLDYLIVDTPPGTSDEHISTIATLLHANPDGAIIVTTPQEVSTITVKKEINFCTKMKLPVLGIIENMSGFVCPCCKEEIEIFKSGGGEMLAREYELPFLGKVPLDIGISTASERGESVFDWKDSPSTQALLQIVNRIITL